MTKNVIVRTSKKEGKGVFALRNFKQEKIILEIDDSRLASKKDIFKLSQEDKKHTAYIGSGTYIEMKSPERYINHSCDPNAYVKNRKVIAMNDIEKDDEITFDYSINGVDGWKMVCRCSSKNCRKIVYGDFRKLNAKLQKKYYPYLEDWFKKEVL